MADGARDAVGRQPLQFRSAGSGDRQVSEDLSFAASGVRDLLRHRHVARRALVLDVRRLLGVVDRLAPNACLPVRIPRGIRHHRRAPGRADRDIFTVRRQELVVARQAVVGVRKQRQVRMRVLLPRRDVSRALA